MSRRKYSKYNRSAFFVLSSILASLALVRCSPVAPSISKLAGIPSGPKSSPLLPVTSEPAPPPTVVASPAPTPTPSVSLSPGVSLFKTALNPSKAHHCVYALPSDLAPHHEMLESLSENANIHFHWKLNESELYTLKNNGALHRSIRSLKGLTTQNLRAWARISKNEISLNATDEAPIQIQLEGDTVSIELSKNILYLNSIDEIGIATFESTKECIPVTRVVDQLVELETLDLEEDSQEIDLPLL